MARKLINAKKISHCSWLTLRKKSIGGSDAGALMDMNPYQSPVSLYADKKGLSKDKETNEAMRLGNDLEDYVSRRWMEKTGKKVRADNFMYQHDDYDFITANIDRDVVGENAGLECKTMSGFAKYDLENGEVPAQYYAQCQHYMLVKGYDKMYLAILVFQRDIYCLEVERNEEFIKELLAAEIDFWTNYIEKDQMPPPDGSDASMEAIKQIYPSDINSQMQLPNADAEIRRYLELGKAIKDIEEEKKKIQAQLCARLGDTGVGIDTEYACSWKSQVKASVDSAKLKKEFPEVYEKCKKTSEFRVFKAKKVG